MYQVTIEKIEELPNSENKYNKFVKEEVYTQVFEKDLVLSDVVKKLNE